MIDSPLMQEIDRITVEQLKLVIVALERDKKALNQEVRIANHKVKELINKLESVNEIINKGNRVNYCAACGTYYESRLRCDCIAGIDY